MMIDTDIIFTLRDIKNRIGDINTTNTLNYLLKQLNDTRIGTVDTPDTLNYLTKLLNQKMDTLNDKIGDVSTANTVLERLQKVIDQIGDETTSGTLIYGIKDLRDKIGDTATAGTTNYLLDQLNSKIGDVSTENTLIERVNALVSKIGDTSTENTVLERLQKVINQIGDTATADTLIYLLKDLSENRIGSVTKEDTLNYLLNILNKFFKLIYPIEARNYSKGTYVEDTDSYDDIVCYDSSYPIANVYGISGATIYRKSIDFDSGSIASESSWDVSSEIGTATIKGVFCFDLGGAGRRDLIILDNYEVHSFDYDNQILTYEKTIDLSSIGSNLEIISAYGNTYGALEWLYLVVKDNDTGKYYIVQYDYTNNSLQKYKEIEGYTLYGITYFERKLYVSARTSEGIQYILQIDVDTFEILREIRDYYDTRQIANTLDGEFVNFTGRYWRWTSTWKKLIMKLPSWFESSTKTTDDIYNKLGSVGIGNFPSWFTNSTKLTDDIVSAINSQIDTKTSVLDSRLYNSTDGKSVYDHLKTIASAVVDGKFLAEWA